MGTQSLHGRERALSLLALGVLSASFLAYAGEFAGRAVNTAWGDIAFGGWSSAVGHHLLSGERLYRDFTVPLPPGAFVVLASIERIAGNGPQLLHEIWVCAISCLALAWLAYAIARPLVGRVNGLFVATGTLAWVSGWSKELAYDYLAQVAAYGVILVVVHACLETDERRARRRFAWAGVASGVTLFFKQSTGSGALAAALVAIAYLAVVERRVGGLRARARDALACLGGVFAAVVANTVAVWALGGSVAGFWQAVFVDGPSLKGGFGFLVGKSAVGVAFGPLVAMSLGQIVGLVGIAALARFRHGKESHLGLAMGVPDGVGVRGRLTPGSAAGAAGVTLAAFCWAAVTLARDSHVPSFFAQLTAFAFAIVQSGVVFTVALCFVNVGHGPGRSPAHAFNAAALSTLTLACAVTGSLATFHPLGEANAVIVVVLSAVFLALEMAGLGGLRPVALALLLAAPLGSKLPRFLLATTKADAPFFQGLRVDEGAREIFRAARRVRELTSDRDTVLVLPEDPSLVMLIDRPRPKLCGGIVFVDQYPRRCLAADQAYLAQHLPKVVVTRPTSPGDWAEAFRSFNQQSPAEILLVTFVVSQVTAYALDSHYRTPWGTASTDLDIWVRR